MLHELFITHCTIRCDHAPLCKFMDFITMNDKVNHWSQEIHVIAPYIDFEHIKSRDSILADSLLILKTLGLYEAKDPEEPESDRANQ